MTRFERLWAKSPRGGEAPQSLVEHSRLAWEAGRGLVERSGERLLRFAGLRSTWLPALAAAVARATFAHDLGKANDHFQLLVRRKLEGCQAHRHEHLGLWLLSPAGPLGAWLFSGCEEPVRVATRCAVAGHHLKLRQGQDLGWADCCRSARMALLLDHEDVAALTREMARCLGLAEPPALCARELDLDDRSFLLDCRDALEEMETALGGPGSEVRRLAALVRAVLMAADLLASTRRAEGAALEEALGAVARGCPAEQLVAIAAARLEGQPLRPFQEAVAASSAEVTVVHAGCGSGKTVAAYRWAAARAAGRKLFFCYPTMGTATQGFLDYLHDSPPESQLLHSHAEVDLSLLANGDEGPEERIEQAARAARALGLWWPQVAACTVDAVLGLLHNHWAPSAAVGALAHAAFVFDEAHQYDERLFATLCRFIAGFRAPVLVMTASLPPRRRQALRAAAAAAGRSLEEVEGPPELEEGRRYRLRPVDEEVALTEARRVLERGGKVLWVRNTVERALAGAERLAGAGLRPLVYHSRFRYQDRVLRHREVMRAFADPGPLLAVTTQVCEVSLDISADLLVSELAPVSALIQRLGRLNRRFDPGRPETREALLVEPPDDHPYEPESHGDWRREARGWLEALGGEPCSQRDLSRAFLALPTADGRRGSIECPLLDGLPWAFPGPVREAGQTIRVLRHEDAEEVRRLERRRWTAEALSREIPMPISGVEHEYRGWPLVGAALAAPPGRIAYSAEMGASWAPRTRR
jgi:CRISPR-associated endonuclease/helicase Cas3